LGSGELRRHGPQGRRGAATPKASSLTRLSPKARINHGFQGGAYPRWGWLLTPIGGFVLPILFQALLREAGLALGDVRLLRHRPEGGVDPLAVWRTDRPRFDEYQSFQLSDRRAHFAAPYWAAFGGVGPRTLFLGVYAARLVGPVEAGSINPFTGEDLTPFRLDRYACGLTDLLAEYSTKLFIDWGASNRAWVQRADRLPKPVTALLEAFRDPPFPGYLEFLRPLSEIAALPEGWADALRRAKGVYVLTCPRTREQYVGKADGAEGFWGRWMAYVTTGHGGNVRLRSRDPSDYQVTILEVAGSAAGERDIIEMEERWKRKLLSREMGLNAN